MNRISLSLVVLALLSSCSGSKLIISDNFNVGISKGACFGSCPVYTMSIDNKGNVLYKGERFTDKIGNHGLKISRQELEAINKKFEAANFASLQDEYANNIPDLPMVSISYQNGELNKTVKGKNERPEVVLELQKVLEEIADREGWLSLEIDSAAIDSPIVEEEKEDKNLIKNELIIKFKENVWISRWLKDFKEYRMFVKEPLTDDKLTWLVQYNPNSIEPEELLKKLQADESVESVEFNRNVNIDD